MNDSAEATWITTAALPPEYKLVLVTGYFAPPETGRWAALAYRSGDQFFADSTGDELVKPTHWREVNLPTD